MSVKKIKCSYCGSLKNLQVYTQLTDRFKIVKKFFDIRSCRSCGITFTALDGFSDFGQLYPKHYLLAESKTETTLSQWYRFDQYKFDTHLLEKATNKKINNFANYLDIGCGSGERVWFMKKSGLPSVSGLDKFDNLPANSPKEKTITFIKSETTRFKPKKKFELVSLFHVLEHIPNVRYVLDHIYRYVLHDGGYMVIQVPNYNSLERKCFGKKWFGLDVPRHVWHFTPETLTYVLNQSGFTVVAIFQKNALLHPVTLAATLLPSADPQRIWASGKKDGVVRSIFSKMSWIFITLISIPYSWLLSLFNTATMLTVVATKN